MKSIVLTAAQVDKMLLELAAISVRYVFIHRLGRSPSTGQAGQDERDPRGGWDESSCPSDEGMPESRR